MERIKHSSEEIILSDYHYFTKSFVGDVQSISGYASVFDVIDNHRDIIKKGAFNNIIESFYNGKNIPLLWQHDPSQPIGTIESLVEDEYGLYIKAKIITSTFRGLESYNLIRAEVICNLSIGYTPVKYYTDYELDARVLEEIDLWEISLVTFPANTKTSVATCA
jgi:uncharacterized protein